VTSSQPLSALVVGSGEISSRLECGRNVRPLHRRKKKSGPAKSLYCSLAFDVAVCLRPEHRHTKPHKINSVVLLLKVGKYLSYKVDRWSGGAVDIST